MIGPSGTHSDKWVVTREGSLAMTSNHMSFCVERKKGVWHLSCTDSRLNGWFLSEDDALTYAECLGGIDRIIDGNIPMPLRPEQVMSVFEGVSDS